MGEVVLRWRRRGHDIRAEDYKRADRFLFGRRTYELFAGYWGVMENSASPFAAALKAPRPDYVASTTLADPALGGHDGLLR